jgi:23S rRNA (guanosine2251-2'-O)-methyltransferase
MDLILGFHSIHAVFEKKKRRPHSLLATDEGWSEYLKTYPKPQNMHPELLAPHAFQERVKKIFQEIDCEYTRPPGAVALTAEELPVFDPGWLRQELDQMKPLRLLALDGITDIHNGAAIMRTASFFGVDVLLLPQEKSFRFTPSFFRIASGATEALKIVRTAHLPRSLTMLKECDVKVVGLSEHAPSDLLNLSAECTRLCLVLGSEDRGLSNGVERILDSTFKLSSQGYIQSLNVASAAALAMQSCFLKRL